MTLKLKPTAKAAKFEYTDGAMDVSWTLDASLEGDRLASMMERITAFYRAQTGTEPLPVRTPGLALARAQEEHPPTAPAPPANGWAAMPPALPDRLQGEVELYGPDEQA